MGLFSKGLKNEFETDVVNEPSVFEPLKFYCKCLMELEYVFVRILQYWSKEPDNINLE